MGNYKIPTFKEWLKKKELEKLNKISEVIAQSGSCDLSAKQIETLKGNKLLKIQFRSPTLVQEYEVKGNIYNCYITEDDFNVYCYITHNDEIVCINHCVLVGNKEINSSHKKITFKNTIMETLIYTDPDYQRKGLASKTYELLLEYNYNIMSSSKQYDGTRKIWKHLSTKYYVNVFDDFIEEFMHFNLSIKSTSIQHLDRTVWSLYPDMSCSNLYLIVSKKEAK